MCPCHVYAQVRSMCRYTEDRVVFVRGIFFFKHIVYCFIDNVNLGYLLVLRLGLIEPYHVILLQPALALNIDGLSDNASSLRESGAILLQQ